MSFNKLVHTDTNNKGPYPEIDSSYTQLLTFNEEPTGNNFGLTIRD